MMIKMNKQRYLDVSCRYSRASWGVLGVLGCPGGNKTDPIESVRRPEQNEDINKENPFIASGFDSMPISQTFYHLSL